MERQATCEERISDRYERAMDDLKNAIEPDFYCRECGHTWSDEDADEYDDPPRCPECNADETTDADDWQGFDRYSEGILGISKREVHYILLSTGGPEDGIEITVQDGEISGAAYVFKDWFDGARRQITGADLERVEQMFSYLVD